MKTVTFGHHDQTQFPNVMKKYIEVKSILEVFKVDVETVIWVHQIFFFFLCTTCR